MNREGLSTSELLGISQTDLAMLLQVTRSQLAMSEYGKRNLPSDATVKLAGLLEQVRPPELLARSGSEIEHYNAKEQKQIGRLLNINHHKQLRTKRKIAAMLRKQEKIARLAQLAKYLNSPLCNGIDESHIHLVTQQALKALEADDSTGLFVLQHKLEVLELDKELLELKLQKLG